MTGSELLAALLVGLGMALLVVGVLARFRSRTENLAEILDLPYGERDVSVEAVTETQNPLLEDTIGLAGRMVNQVDPKGSLLSLLERARVPMRPGELVLAALAAAVVAAIVFAAITEQWVIGIAVGIAVPPAVVGFLKLRVERRRKAFEAQLPEALSLIAASLTAGHTFLRSIQMMCEEAEPPLAEEFARVVAETRLGDPVVDTLERMAERLQITDLVWVVQAIRIQQTVGGKLADLLHTLAEFIRAREEIRREISVLTAEGRMSAWVLGGLPVFLLLTIQVMSPSYLEPLFRGWGLVVLGLCALSVAAGVLAILRLVKIEV